MTSTTPLLFLLDSVLSQEPARIREGRTRIREVVAKVSPGLAARPVQQGCDFLVQDVDMLLTAFPNLASVASTHDGSLPLHFAASIGNVKAATRILSQYPAAASTPNTKGKIPLHYAAREGRSDVVAYFLCATPQTAEITSKKKKLALHFAAGDGHTDVVRQLLRVYPRGASLPSAKGKLPLHFAARWGHIQIASDLLYLYPEGVRCVDWDGSLPLHDAAREGQVVMSKFLIERYPIGLSVANIRREIPLFPAVRSGSVDLVILYLQGWALGGMHILKSVSADDNIKDWDWRIVELCLRGAVENFSDCDLMKGRELPAVCCSVDREDFTNSTEGQNSTAARLMRACCNSPFRPDAGLNAMKKAVVGPTSCCISQSEFASFQQTTATHISIYQATGPSAYLSDQEEPIPRSKSPILEYGGSRSKKRLVNGEGNDRKRVRSDKGDDDLTTTMLCRRKFIALHAALACGASSHVIRCVINKHPDQVSEKDEKGQFPLHLAVRHLTCGSKQSTPESTKLAERTDDEKHIPNLVLEDILKPHPDAASSADHHGNLPLHLAIAAKADFCIIQALVQANPSSGVDPVQSSDSRFDKKPPIYMATEFDCDLSTTYLLLRENPSVVCTGANSLACRDGRKQ